MPHFSLTDLIGYAFGVLGIFVAVIIYYRAKLDTQILTTDVRKLNEAFQTYKETVARAFGSLNDIAFSSLLKVKNFPADNAGLLSQREVMVGAVMSIQKIAAREGG